MPDEWPYGPPAFTTWDTFYRYLLQWGFSANNADIGAAIAEAEGGFDLTVVNNTPSTGDYSVGTIQLNYYGSLYAGRVAEFGTPRAFANSGASGQAHAMVRLRNGRGNFDDWSTYTSGAYVKFLHGKIPPGPRPGPNPYPNPTISPPTEDYSATVRAGAASAHNLGIAFDNAATVLRRLKG